MKPYFDPKARPIEPLEGDLDEPYLDDSDIDNASFQLIDTTEPKDRTKTKPKLTTKSTVDTQKPQASDTNTSNTASSVSPEIDNQTIFNAERLLKSRVQDGKTQYLVKWVGFPLNQSTWEDKENILGQRLFDNFNKQQS